MDDKLVCGGARIYTCTSVAYLDPDPLVRGMDPDPDPPSKINKKNLDSYCFVTFFDFLSLKNDVIVH